MYIYIYRWKSTELTSYSHIKREGNSVAHNLAQLTANIPNCVIWMEDVPSDVLSFYHADLAGIS